MTALRELTEQEAKGVMASLAPGRHVLGFSDFQNHKTGLTLFMIS